MLYFFFSNFLDKLKQVLDPSAMKPSSTRINPAAPSATLFHHLQQPSSSTTTTAKQSSYESHFDFPAKPRYCKLPVTFENSNGTSSHQNQSRSNKTLMINKIKRVEITLPTRKDGRNKLQNKRVLLSSTKENRLQ